MALSMKDLKAITTANLSEAMLKLHSDSFPTHTNELIPCEPEEQEAYFKSKKGKKLFPGITLPNPSYQKPYNWKTQAKNNAICDTLGCGNDIDDPDYRFCKLCRSDRNYAARWGKQSPDYGSHFKYPERGTGVSQVPVEDPALTEAYIQMMKAGEDDDNLQRSMDILYPEKKEK